MIWILAHKRLLTQSRMQHLNLTTQGNCNICDGGLETTNHLFASCRYSRDIFAKLGDWCGIKLPGKDCINRLLQYRERSATKKKIVGLRLAPGRYNTGKVGDRRHITHVVQNTNIVTRNSRHKGLCCLDK